MACLLNSKFLRHVRDEIIDRVKIAREHLVVFYRDSKMLLEIGNKSNDSHGIDYVAEQRSVGAQLAGITGKKMVDNKGSYFTFNINSGLHRLKASENVSEMCYENLDLTSRTSKCLGSPDFGKINGAIVNWILERIRGGQHT